MRNQFHLITGTHWDREWLHPFEHTQAMLVDMMDDLLDYMENEPDYKYFHLDGQTVIVEDYLRLRPENKDRLVSLIKEGRILVGPHYSLIDESHSMGESMIRNLLIGNKQAESYGGRMDVGYSPAGFGRVSQIPQIFRSVGLDTVIFYHGLRQDRSKFEFIWEAPDGSELLALRLTGPEARAWFFIRVSCPVAYPDGVPQDGLFKMQSDLSGSGHREPMFFSPAGYGTRFDEDKIETGLKGMEEALAADTESNQLLTMHGDDYGGPEKTTCRVVEKINELAGYDKVRISALPRFIEAFKDSLHGKEMTTLTGEFRESRRTARDLVVATGAISSGSLLKRPNRDAELALARWAEAWDAFAFALTGKSWQVLLEGAWKELIASQAHDSVTGQGTDAVIDNVLNRLIRVKQSADGVTNYALASIAKQIDMPDAEPNSVYLTIFNPSPFARDEVLKINVDMPFYRPDSNGRTDLAEIWFDDQIDTSRLIDVNDVELDIRDADGNSVDFAVAEVIPMKPFGLVHPGWGGRRMCAHRYVVTLRTGEVPPLGYRVVVARFVGKTKEAADEPKISRETNGLENEHIKIKINGNGTLDITDKRTGRTCPGGLLFEDGLEFGSSLWSKCKEIVRFADEEAEITLVENTHLLATYEIRLSLRIPIDSVNKRTARSSELVDLPITSLVTLKKGSRRVDVTTRLENRSKDHRLRVLFPTEVDTDYAWADQPFDIVKRSIKMEKEDPAPLEAPYATQPCISFVDVNDGKEGVALLTLGVPEYEVMVDDSRTIAITLLRCFQDLNKKCGEIDPTLERTHNLGKHEFKYAIYPHGGDVYSGGVHRESEIHMLPMNVMQSGMSSSKGVLDSSLSFVDVGNDDIALSAIKRSEKGDSIVVRLYNPTEKNIETRLKLWRPMSYARVVDSLERPLSDLDVNDVRLHFGPKKLLSVELGLTDDLSRVGGKGADHS